jgi:DNA-binding transcriptional MerR regulator
MLINETSKMTKLTKKAIEYYIEQNLVSPIILENGYRDFNKNDIDKLNKISLFRKLGLTAAEIKDVFEDETGSVLQNISVQKELNVQRESAKKAILDKLSSGKTIREISAEINAIENSETVTEKLLDAFPGYYGRFICLHFARFLNDTITTKEQQTAYQEIITFLDNVPYLNLPEELQSFLMENTKHIGTEDISKIIENTKQSIENPDEFIAKNKEMLEQYLSFKQSEEYKNSPVYKIQSLLKEFNNTSGYYDVFIPAMKKLSPSYAEYYKQIEIADEKLLLQYPEIAELNN